MTRAEIIKAWRKWHRYLYRTTDMSGGLWDWPTLGICRPGMYSAGMRLRAIARAIVEAEKAKCATGAEG